MASKTNPGRTQKRRGNWGMGGKVPPSRVSWVDFFAGTISVDAYDEPEEAVPEGLTAEELGESVSLILASYFEQRSVKFILTHFTEAELDAFERIIVKAIDRARPTAMKRDQIAREAMERGDDSHQRVYRRVPQVVERQRKS